MGAINKLTTIALPIEQSTDGVVVQVRLFSRLLADIHFPRQGATVQPGPGLIGQNASTISMLSMGVSSSHRAGDTLSYTSVPRVSLSGEPSIHSLVSLLPSPCRKTLSGPLVLD